MLLIIASTKGDYVSVPKVTSNGAKRLYIKLDFLDPVRVDAGPGGDRQHRPRRDGERGPSGERLERRKQADRKYQRVRKILRGTSA